MSPGLTCSYHPRLQRERKGASVLCPFAEEVGPVDGPWKCPRSQNRHDCHCTDCILMFGMGELDDKIEFVVTWWRERFDHAENPWLPDIPDLPALDGLPHPFGRGGE